MTLTAHRIDDLKDVPVHRDTVADRIWNAWWRTYGHALSDIEAKLDEAVAAKDYPSFTLVAHEQGVFLGTVTVIADDIAARPELGPCIAALWVDEAARGRGIAQDLMAAACARLANSGFAVTYLSARRHLRDYYLPRGWTLVESDVGDDNLDVFCRALP